MKTEIERKYLVTESLNVLGEDVGGPYPRKLNYYPATGKARVKKLETLRNHTLAQREEQHFKQLKKPIPEPDIELF